MKAVFAVFLLLFFLTTVLTWPLIVRMNSLVIDPHDGLLITWFLNWDIHALTSGLAGLVNFYNANIFYPYRNTLAFSETMLPSAILAAPAVLIFKEPILAYNLNLLLGFVLTGTAVYCLAYYLTGRQPISVLTAVLFTFSPIHLNYLPHLQLFNFWPMAFATLFLLKKSRMCFAFFFLVATLTQTLSFYFLLTSGVIYFVVFPKERWWTLKTLLVSFVVTGPFLLPYWLVSRTWHYQRPITDAINFSLQFPGLLTVGGFSRLGNLIAPLTRTTPAYFGGVFLALVIALVFRVRRSRDKVLIFFLVLAAVSFVLALGPALHIYENTVHVGPLRAIPLPYAVFYYLVPGFSGMRTPSRWILLTAFALVMAVGVYFGKKITWRWTILLSFLVLAEVNFPFKYTRVPRASEFPPEQVWLQDHYGGAPIIQFPIYGWFDPTSPRLRRASELFLYVNGVGEETLREYYSTIHWHPMFNGYSGFSPREWEERVRWMQKNCPSEECLSFLRSKGIKLAVVDSTSPAGDWGEMIKEFPAARIYGIL